MQVNLPGRSLAEVTVCVSVTEQNLNATRCRLSITQPTRETFLTGVRLTPAVRVRAVVALSMDTGTGCVQTGSYITLTSHPPV